MLELVHDFDPETAFLDRKTSMSIFNAVKMHAEKFIHLFCADL